MSSKGDHIAYAITLSFLSISLIFLFITLFFIYRKNTFKHDNVSSPSTKDSPSITKKSIKNFPLSEIDTATDRFNPRRIIGKGRIGTNYVANLENGDLVLVKRIHPWLVLSNSKLGFQSIIKSLSLAQHPNIAPIMGFSEGPGERIILMELVGTMSLDSYLHQNVDGSSLLGWDQRLTIAAGMARGLEYLHEKMTPQVVHGCVKPSNVLIDVKLNAKICDYGLYFLGSKLGKTGVLGYVDEEYWVEGKNSKESDVYGFGVVLLEMLTGRRSDGGVLVRWVLPLIKEMRFSEVLDPRVKMPSNMKCIVRLAKVALACVGNSRKTRPNISQIVCILDSLDLDT